MFSMAVASFGCSVRRGEMRNTAHAKMKKKHGEPYVVMRKDGNAVILQDTNGNNNMRNIAHIKKFVDPETVDKGEIDLQPHLAEQPECSLNRITQIKLQADTREAPSSPLSSVASRPVHARQAPAWMQDYVCA